MGKLASRQDRFKGSNFRDFFVPQGHMACMHYVHFFLLFFFVYFFTLSSHEHPYMGNLKWLNFHFIQGKLFIKRKCVIFVQVNDLYHIQMANCFCAITMLTHWLLMRCNYYLWIKKRCVCETWMPPMAIKSEMAIFSIKVTVKVIYTVQ